MFAVQISFCEIIKFMSFFRRIGTVRHKYKVEFFIKRVTFNKVLGGTVYVSLHRGSTNSIQGTTRPSQKKCLSTKRLASSTTKC